MLNYVVVSSFESCTVLCRTARCCTVLCCLPRRISPPRHHFALPSRGRVNTSTLLPEASSFSKTPPFLGGFLEGFDWACVHPSFFFSTTKAALRRVLPESPTLEAAKSRALPCSDTRAKFCTSVLGLPGAVKPCCLCLSFAFFFSISSNASPKGSPKFWGTIPVPPDFGGRLDILRIFSLAWNPQGGEKEGNSCSGRLTRSCFLKFPRGGEHKRTT